MSPLWNPRAVATDASGNVYVIAGAGTSQAVQKFSASGKFLLKFGASTEPSGLALDPKGNVWVADTYNNRVTEYNSTGTFVKSITPMEKPRAVAVDSAGNLWVVMTYVAFKYDQNGSFLAGTALPNATPNGGVAVDVDSSGNAWITATNHLLEVNSSGVTLANKSFSSVPTGVAVDNAGNPWVAFPSLCRVEQFSPAGVSLSSFGECGTGAGKLSGISAYAGLSVGPEGAIWVANGSQNEVQKWVPTP